MAFWTSPVELWAQGGSERSKNDEKSHSDAAAAKTGSRNMAEIAPMSSQIPTSYSSSYTLGCLSRLHLVVLTGNFYHWPVLKAFGLSRFCTGFPKCTRSDV